MKWLSSVTIAVLAVFANGQPRRVTAEDSSTPPCRAGTLDLRAQYVGGGKHGILGMAPKHNFVPLTSLEIPNLTSFSNNGSFVLNPFASLPSLDASNLIPRQS
jgi:hypothetical protein